MGSSTSRPSIYPLAQPGQDPYYNNFSYQRPPTNWLNISRKGKEKERWHPPPIPIANANNANAYPAANTYGTQRRRRAQTYPQPEPGYDYARNNNYQPASVMPQSQPQAFQPGAQMPFVPPQPRVDPSGYPSQPMFAPQPQPQSQSQPHPRQQAQMQMPEPAPASAPVIPPEPNMGAMPPPPIINGPTQPAPAPAPDTYRPGFVPNNIYAPPAPSFPQPEPAPEPWTTRNRNPLPSPPRDIWDEHSPYRTLLRDLPASTALLTGNTSQTQPQPLGFGQLDDDGRAQRRGTGLFGSRRKKKESSRGGLFRSLSASAGSSQRGDGGLSFHFPPPIPQPPLGTQVPVIPSYTQPQPQPQPPPQPQQFTIQTQPPDERRPVKFNHQTPLAGFLNHSPHRVLYQNKMYPSALHLLEALKFVGHRPDLAERIRKCKDAVDVYPLSASLNEHVRSDWSQAFLREAEEVLYLKFKQHPDLRSLLMNTGVADIVYAEANDGYWGEGPTGQGANELGKALVRVRNRLRAEGY